MSHPGSGPFCRAESTGCWCAECPCLHGRTRCFSIGRRRSYTPSGRPEGTVIQTVGCGDSMLAGFLSRWLEQQDYDDALTFAVACGSATAFSSHLAERDDIWNLYKMLRQSSPFANSIACLPLICSISSRSTHTFSTWTACLCCSSVSHRRIFARPTASMLFAGHLLWLLRVSSRTR